METLIKAFERFLYRDLTFITGGAIEIAAFLHLYCCAPLLPELSGASLFLWAAIAYVLGYVTQEFFTLIRIVRTQAKKPPCGCVLWLFRCWERRSRDWKPLPSREYDAAKLWLFGESAPARLRDEYERIESLKQLGTAIGPCLVVAGSMFFLPLVKRGGFASIEWDSRESTTALLAFTVGLFLILLGWLQLTRQREFPGRYFRASERDNRFCNSRSRYPQARAQKLRQFRTSYSIEGCGARPNLLRNKVALQKTLETIFDGAGLQPVAASPVINIAFQIASDSDGLNGYALSGPYRVTCSTSPEDGYIRINVYAPQKAIDTERLTDLFLNAFGLEKAHLQVDSAWVGY